MIIQGPGRKKANQTSINQQKLALTIFYQHDIYAYLSSIFVKHEGKAAPKTFEFWN